MMFQDDFTPGQQTYQRSRAGGYRGMVRDLRHPGSYIFCRHRPLHATVRAALECAQRMAQTYRKQGEKR